MMAALDHAVTAAAAAAFGQWRLRVKQSLLHIIAYTVYAGLAAIQIDSCSLPTYFQAENTSFGSL